MLQILTGDCMEILPTLESASVQCCVTSPPYWGLRDYGTAQWEGGSIECDHIDEAYEGSRISNSPKQLSSRGSYEIQFKSECAKCGARRVDLQAGLEETPEAYVAKMVTIFREVWRVLRDDGTLWVNMGDSYCSTAPGTMGERMGNLNLGDAAANARKNFRPKTPKGLKPKDLVGIPWRVAMALQADGWYLRSDIVWHKPNPMPESVTDRPTKSHEYIFLLAKQERYFYDAEAIREDAVKIGTPAHLQGGRGKRAGTREGLRGAQWDQLTGRNKRTVWTIATQPYAEAHFATFPEELPKLCIMAGSRFGDTVLDPFAGSGTTGRVAIELGRKAILIELNPKYVELINKRTDVTPAMI